MQTKWEWMTAGIKKADGIEALAEAHEEVVLGGSDEVRYDLEEASDLDLKLSKQHSGVIRTIMHPVADYKEREKRFRNQLFDHKQRKIRERSSW